METENHYDFFDTQYDSIEAHYGFIEAILNELMKNVESLKKDFNNKMEGLINAIENEKKPNRSKGK